MKKAEIINIINEKVDNLLDWLEDHDDIQFEISNRPNKWTTGQHVDHLIKSMTHLATAFTLPKFFLKYKFGTNNRNERTYKETYDRYIHTLATENIVPGKRYQPAIIKNDQKKSKLLELDCARKKIISKIKKYSEKDMSTYLIPHPAIGRLTIREILYFTAFHAEHHHKTLKEYH